MRPLSSTPAAWAPRLDSRARSHVRRLGPMAPCPSKLSDASPRRSLRPFGAPLRVLAAHACVRPGQRECGPARSASTPPSRGLCSLTAIALDDIRSATGQSAWLPSPGIAASRTHLVPVSSRRRAEGEGSHSIHAGVPAQVAPEGTPSLHHSSPRARLALGGMNGL